MISLHEPIGLRAYEAAALGEAFAEEHEAYDNSGMVNTAKIIRQLGGVSMILAGGLQSPTSELLSVYDEGNFKVFVGDSTPVSLDRLHDAQAIGHYSLHFITRRKLSGGLPKQAIFRLREDDTTSGGVFNEAYYFALGMTMNRSFIEWQAEAAVGDADAAAKRLGVPRFAMLTRMKQLELTTPSAP